MSAREPLKTSGADLNTFFDQSQHLADAALLDGDQAAAFLGLQRRTLENWRWRGEGPPFLRVGRAIRYSRKDLAAWLDVRRCNNTGEATRQSP